MANSPRNNVFTYIGGDDFTSEGQIRAYQLGADTIIEFNTVGTEATPEMEIRLVNFTLTNLDVADFAL